MALVISNHTVWKFDPSCDKIALIGYNPLQIRNHAAVQLDGPTFLLFGGEIKAGDTEDKYQISDKIIRYQIDKGKWTIEKKKLDTPVKNIDAQLMWDGAVAVGRVPCQIFQFEKRARDNDQVPE
jgi:N-acetylneuraminic acid mutarotase